jgi:hypothetical protein
VLEILEMALSEKYGKAKDKLCMQIVVHGTELMLKLFFSFSYEIGNPANLANTLYELILKLIHFS